MLLLSIILGITVIAVLLLLFGFAALSDEIDDLKIANEDAICEENCFKSYVHPRLLDKQDVLNLAQANAQRHIDGKLNNFRQEVNRSLIATLGPSADWSTFGTSLNNEAPAPAPTVNERILGIEKYLGLQFTHQKQETRGYAKIIPELEETAIPKTKRTK